VKEQELRERLLMMLPTLRHPTFIVISSRFSSRIKRGLLDRTMRHMRQDGLLEETVVATEQGSVRRYRLTQEGLTERAHLMLRQARHARAARQRVG
jgi:DNA-binding PadR family transcriptional regulator